MLGNVVKQQAFSQIETSVSDEVEQETLSQFGVSVSDEGEQQALSQIETLVGDKRVDAIGLVKPFEADSQLEHYITKFITKRQLNS